MTLNLLYLRLLCYGPPCIAVDYIGCEMQLALPNARTTLNEKKIDIKQSGVEGNNQVSKTPKISKLKSSNKPETFSLFNKLLTLKNPHLKVTK